MCCSPPVSTVPAIIPLVAALVLLPLLVGLGLGRLLRGRSPSWMPPAVAAAAVALSCAAIRVVDEIGAWDVVWIGLVFGAGVLAGSSRIDRRDWLAALVATLIGMAALETAVRLWLPPAPSFPSPEGASFFIPAAAWDVGCTVLYGSVGVETSLHVLHGDGALPPRQRQPLVVHLGDSMTFGYGVREEQTFPALLDRLQPEVGHANYGVWAVGPDFEYLLLQKLLATQRPALVVLHVYVGNDVYDLDRAYACCEGGPLLDYAADGPRARCPTPRWAFPLAVRLARSPPPYVLRAATGWSHTARHAAADFSRLTARLETPPHFISTEGEAGELGWKHLERILAQMRADLAGRGIDFVVTLLPIRRALESADPSDPGERARRRIAAVTSGLGIPTLDSWDLFAAAVRRDGSSRYFVGDRDIHFTPQGHRLLAEWLATRLPVH
jgi:hypothetical protein